MITADPLKRRMGAGGHFLTSRSCVPAILKETAITAEATMPIGTFLRNIHEIMITDEY
jgi:hypothetical protein